MKRGSPGESSGENHWQVLKVTSNVINSLVDFNGLIVGILIHRSTFSEGWPSCKANRGPGKQLQGGCSPQPQRCLQNLQSGHGHRKASLGTCSSRSIQSRKTRNRSLQKCLVYGQSLNTEACFQDIEYCLSAKQYSALFVIIIVQRNK